MTLSRTRRLAAIAVGSAVFASGCVNILQQNLPAAMQTAQSRGQFELDCPQVETSVLSQKTVEGIRWELAEYTIGVRGCGRQAIYLTYCRDPQDCNAVAQTGRVEGAPMPPPGYPAELPPAAPPGYQPGVPPGYRPGVPPGAQPGMPPGYQPGVR